MDNSDGSFIVGEWSVEPALDRITSYSKNTYLRSQVMELLVYLAKRHDQVVSLEDLLNDLWADKTVTAGTVYNCIAELRSALAEGSEQPIHIETIPKKGYRLVANVRTLTDPSETLVENNNSTSLTNLDSRSTRGRLVILAVAIVGLLTLLTMLSLGSKKQFEDPQYDHFTRRYTIDLPLSMRAEKFEFRPVTITPDGRRIVFHAAMNGQEQLFSRSLDSLNVAPVKGTENASIILSLSPDGKWIVFIDESDNMLKKIPINGGIPVALCDIDAPILGLSWGINGSIVFESNSYAGLMQVSAKGGIPEKLTFPAKGEYHKHPNFSPDGNSLFFTVGERGMTTRKSDRIALLSLQSGKQKMLMEGASPRLTANGYLIYYRNFTLWGVAFEANQLEVSSHSIPIAEGVHYNQSAHYNISAEGTLLYVLDTSLQPRNLVWVDRDGKMDDLTLDRRAYSQPNISPNGNYIAAIVPSKNGADLWMYSLKQGTSTRLTFDESREASPVWSPDGKYIYYSSNRVDDLFRVTTDGNGLITQITNSLGYQYSNSITPDGQYLLYSEWDSSLISESYLAMISVFDKTTPKVLLQTEFSETDPALSPDGNWLAYTSNRSGRTEIYISPFPNVNESVWQLSVDGGKYPRWNPNGQELFYRGPDDLMSVDIKTAPNFVASRAKALFSHKSFVFYDLRNFDIHPSGERFLMVRKPSEDEFPNNRIVIVQDWLNQLTPKYPTK